MNAIVENMITRRSIKKYRPDPVPEELMNEVIEAGEYAASGMGRQPCIILAVTNKEVRDKLSASLSDPSGPFSTQVVEGFSRSFRGYVYAIAQAAEIPIA